PGRFSEDIDNQVADNYAYDAIGNLVKDDAENIRRIVWTVYGKIDSIYKVDGTLISYGYDGGGNRVSKRVKVGDNTTDTWYVRDAQGNVLNVYTYNVTDGLSLSETHLYGSSRLGIMNRNVHVSDGTGADDIGYTIDDVILIGKKYNFERGYKVFEIGNHLGNVLVAVSDRKKGVRNPSNVGEVLYYRADVRSASDYYAFGAPVKGRSYQGGGYRYGFNGKENDNEISGEGNKLDFGARIYDSRLGRWLSVDPLQKKYPGFSTYNYALNSPVFLLDPDGNEVIGANSLKHMKTIPYKEPMSLITKTDVFKRIVAPFVKGGMYDVNKVDLIFGSSDIGAFSKVERKDGVITDGITGSVGLYVKLSGVDDPIDITTLSLDQVKNVERYQMKLTINESIFSEELIVTVNHELSTHVQTLGKMLNGFLSGATDLETLKSSIIDMKKQEEKDFRSTADHLEIGNNKGDFRELNLEVLKSVDMNVSDVKLSNKVITNYTLPSGSTITPDVFYNRLVHALNRMIGFYNKTGDIPNQYSEKRAESEDGKNPSNPSAPLKIQ
ncbi:RHS repeat domain-containing protein, partial [Polluticaenibacter yanchengensis]|nr:RHS repeat-associated core domain-containing protein [Chitinophagaceae bacterium LY-5]